MGFNSGFKGLITSLLQANVERTYH